MLGCIIFVRGSKKSVLRAYLVTYWDTWDTHVGHYLNKYVARLSITESLNKCPVSQYCSVVGNWSETTYRSVPGSGTAIMS